MNKLVDGTDKTHKQNLNQVAKSKKVKPETLYKLPKVPDEIKYLLNWFYELKKTSDPITYSEVKAWNELTGNNATPDEVSVLMRIDLTYNFQNKKDK